MWWETDVVSGHSMFDHFFPAGGVAVCLLNKLVHFNIQLVFSDASIVLFLLHYNNLLHCCHSNINKLNVASM